MASELGNPKRPIAALPGGWSLPHDNDDCPSLRYARPACCLAARGPGS